MSFETIVCAGFCLICFIGCFFATGDNQNILGLFSLSFSTIGLIPMKVDSKCRK